jgi:hypothetical protein
MSWEDGSERYLAAYRGESVDDAPAPCRDCRDGVNWHCGDCGCCQEAAPPTEAEEADATGLAIVALAAVVDLLVCKAQLPLGLQPAPVAECACRECETAHILNAAIRRLEAA